MTFFTHLNVSRKLFAAFAVLVALVILINGDGLWTAYKLKSHQHHLFEKELLGIDYLLETEVNAIRLSRAERDYLLAESDADRSSIAVSMERYRAQHDEVLREARARVTVPETEHLLKAYDAAWTGFLEHNREIIELGRTSAGIAPAIHLIRTEGAALSAELDEILHELIEFERASGAETAASADRLYWQSLWIGLALLALVIGASALLGRHIARLIARPLQALDREARKVAGGNLDARVEIDQNDELGSLANSFNAMVQRIRENQEMVQEEKQRVEAAGVASEAQRRYLDEKIEEMLQIIHRFAGGDLTGRLQVEKDDAIGKLFNGFNLALDRIGELIRAVIDSTHQNAGAVAQIAGSSEELSAGSQEQSAQAGEIAAAVEEMARTITFNAENASRTAESAALCRTIADEGKRAVHETILNFEHVAGIVEGTVSVVERLGSSSQQIGEITAVIDEIAEQTNLLALNAAIEAARAGESGKGFAVVADEVRKLAERTTGATMQITTMIGSVQQETERAVSEIHQGRTEVLRGKELADDSGAAIERIVEEIGQVVENITQIAAANEEQSATAEELARNVENVSTVATHSAQGITQIAEATGDLNDLTSRLLQLLGTFTLDSGPGIERAVPSAPVPAPAAW